MVDIQSKEVIDKISDELKVQPAMQIPRALAKDIQLVYNVEPPRVQKDFGHTGRVTSSGTTAIFIASAKKRTFLTGFTVSYEKDVSSDGVSVTVQATIKGNASADTILRLESITLTAKSEFVSVQLENPIELEPSTAVNLIKAFTLGVLVSGATVSVYTTDPQ